MTNLSETHKKQTKYFHHLGFNNFMDMVFESAITKRNTSIEVSADVFRSAFNSMMNQIEEEFDDWAAENKKLFINSYNYDIYGEGWVALTKEEKIKRERNRESRRRAAETRKKIDKEKAARTLKNIKNKFPDLIEGLT